jgi:hypothetical protein
MPTIIGPYKDNVLCTFSSMVPARSRQTPSQQRIGVGEVVTLELRVDKCPADPRELRKAVWRLRAGSPDALQADNTGPNPKARFTAPDVTGTSLSYKVVLELKPPASAYLLAQVEFEVVRPSGGGLLQVAGRDFHYHEGPTPKPNAGLFGKMYLTPNDVSFMNVEFHEGGGTNKATGAFKSYNNKEHDPGRSWAVAESVTELGTMFDAEDKVYSAAMDWDPKSRTDQTGTTECQIEWLYRVKGSSGSGKLIGTVGHLATVDKAGAVTLTKGGATVTKPFGPPNQRPYRN